MAEINLPKDVAHIINVLNANGYCAYVVGGCVRDSIMGATPNDWDICTDARPEDTMRIFRNEKIIPTGLQHGTVTIVISGAEYEVTTFRIDGEYSDCRHPDSVEYVKDVKLDLMRRDFTINAMAYSDQSGIIDYFNGYEDIHNKIIRCVGDPNERFTEDALRILRAIRFASRFGFTIEKNTGMAMIRNAGSLAGVSRERITSELIKTLSSKELNTEICSTLIEALRPVIPEFGKLDKEVVSNAMLHREYDVRLAILFSWQENIYATLKGMKFSNAQIDRILAIIKCGNRISYLLCNKMVTNIQSNKADRISYWSKNIISDYELKKMIYEAGEYNVKAAISYVDSFIYDCDSKYLINDFAKRVVEYCESGNALYSMKDLQINGDVLIDLGYRGIEIGKCLNSLIHKVLDDKIENSAEQLKNEALTMRDEK